MASTSAPAQRWPEPFDRRLAADGDVDAMSEAKVAQQLKAQRVGYLLGVGSSSSTESRGSSKRL